MRAPTSVNDRDIAGTAAFELSLQYLLIRQDRAYAFVQLFTAVFSLLFLAELALVGLTPVVLPLLRHHIPERWLRYVRLLVSPSLGVLSLVALLLLRASKKRFVVEPGDQTLERLNRDVLEPCLGMCFDVETGKLYADERRWETEETLEFYAMRYSDVASQWSSEHSP